MPDHDGGPKRDLVLINRNLRDDNRIQYLLKPADGRFDLPLVGFRPLLPLLMVAIACFFSSRSFRRCFSRSAPSRVM